MRDNGDNSASSPSASSSGAVVRGSKTANIISTSNREAVNSALNTPCDKFPFHQAAIRLKINVKITRNITGREVWSIIRQVIRETWTASTSKAAQNTSAITPFDGKIDEIIRRREKSLARGSSL